MYFPLTLAAAGIAAALLIPLQLKLLAIRRRQAFHKRQLWLMSKSRVSA